MKKNSFAVFLIAAVAVCLAYVFAVFMPLNSSVKTMNEQKKLLDSSIKLADTYIAGAEQFENKISQLNVSVDEIYKALYVNESNVYENIGEICDLLSVTLNSIEIERSSTSGNYLIYPLELTVFGNAENVITFVEYIENIPGGSYVINSLTLDGTASTVSAELGINLYSPVK